MKKTFKALLAAVFLIVEVPFLSSIASADQAIHVGDQHKSDVLGAKSAGMHAILLDREGYSVDVDDCPVVQSLADIRPLLLEGKAF